MNFNRHYELNDNAHATFPASSPSWLNYSYEKLAAFLKNQKAKEIGTKLHAYARNAIELQQLQRDVKETLPMYINDAILFNMHPEQKLVYSRNFFGTADAICFDENEMSLRIHDLKTGAGPVHVEQLKIYAALFVLEYGPIYDISPSDISYNLRIYQNNEVNNIETNAEEISKIMETIVNFDNYLNNLEA